MRVKDVMTPHPVTCSPRTNLAEAAALMLEADCGVLPVLEDGRLTGVVTDRDLFIALGTRHQLAADVAVGDVMRDRLFTCAPEDEVHEAMALMKTHRVRRLPVAGIGQILLGIISMNDIVRAVSDQADVASDEVVDTLQTICSHRLPAAPVVVA